MKKSSLYLVFSLILPILGISFFYKSFTSYNDEIKLNMNYIMTPSKELNDVIFIGNSRTNVQIDPRQIDSVTGLKSYNLGLDGSNVPFFAMALNKYLQCHPAPRYVFINADFSCFNLSEKVYNYPNYQVYLGDSIVSASLTPYYNEFKNSLLGQFALFRQINSKPDDVKMANIIYHLKGIRQRDHENMQDARRGFCPSDGQWEDVAHKITTYNAIYSSRGFDLMRQMIRTCQENNIKVMLLCTPLYKDYDKIIVNYGTIRDSLQNIADTYHVPYWIYADTYISDTTANFYNVEHLSANGASIFSKMLGEDIKKYVADSTYLPDMASKRAETVTP